MPVTTSTTANDVINRVAVEVGLNKTQDPVGSQDNNFIQLTELLNIAGEELAIMHDWNFLTRNASINTTTDNSGDYQLPADFLHITNQTVWERNNRVRVHLLSAQEWQYLEGRQFASDTIYAKFRLQQGRFTIYPQPTPTGLDIHYEYISKAWVLDETSQVTNTFENFLTLNGEQFLTVNGLEFNVLDTDQFSDEVKIGTDIVLYDKTLISRYLKVKWLEAKGFDSTKAQMDFNQIFMTLSGYDKGAANLNAGYGYRGFPFLDVYRNVSDTNFGAP